MESVRAEFDVLLYDLTSTYVEGAAEKNPIDGAWLFPRSSSRLRTDGHRTDRQQRGFPFSYETLDAPGRRFHEETILRRWSASMARRGGSGLGPRIVSEENLAAIRKRGGQYLVGTPRRQMKQFEEQLLKDDWTRYGRSGSEVRWRFRKVRRKRNDPTSFLGFTWKTRSSVWPKPSRPALKDRNKMERRLGRIQARIPR